MTDVTSKSVDFRGLRNGYVAVLVAAIALYVATCAPGAVWQDSGVIQYRVLTRDIEGHLGLALSHPLYYVITIITSLVPWGEFTYRVNLTTAVISAFAVANLFLLLRLWTGRSSAGVIGALTLALSHTFWRHATIPETYNLMAALLFIELAALLLYGRTGGIGWLWLLGFFNGLGVANHMLASISLACYMVLGAVLLIRRQVKVWQMGVVLGFWVLGALPFEILFLRQFIATGDLQATVASALFGNQWQDDVLNASITGRIVVENLVWMGFNLATPNVLLIVIGLRAVSKGSRDCWFHRIVVALLVLYLVFAFRYTVEDRYAFFIPFYCVAAILIGVGAFELIERFSGKGAVVMLVVFSLTTIPVYIAAPIVADELNVFDRARSVPYRDDGRYFLRPWRTGYHGADMFAEEAFGGVERNGVILADGTTAPPLLCRQMSAGIRPDIAIVSSISRTNGAPRISESTIGEVLAERDVYVVSGVKGYCPSYILDRYDLAERGVLSKVVERRPGQR